MLASEVDRSGAEAAVPFSEALTTRWSRDLGDEALDRVSDIALANYHDIRNLGVLGSRGVVAWRVLSRRNEDHGRGQSNDLQHFGP